jgi:hypothetical protein
MCVSVAGCAGRSPAATASPVGAPPATAATPTELAPELPALPAIPSALQPEPASLAATVAIPAPTRLLANLAAYADAVVPGASAMLNAVSLRPLLASELGDAVAALLDFDRPVRALVLDPTAVDGVDTPVLVLLPIVADDADAIAELARRAGEAVTVSHGGYVAIAERNVMIAAAPYALTTLIAEPPPAHPIVTVRADRLAAAHAGALDAALAQLGASLELADLPAQPTLGASPRATLEFLTEVVTGIVRDTRALTLELRIDAAAAALVLSLEPRSNTAMSRAVSGHPNPDMRQLARVPAAPVVWIARMDWMRVLERMAPMYSEELRALYTSVYADMQELSYAIDVSGQQGSVAGTLSYGSPATANRALAAISEALDRGFGGLPAGLALAIKHEARAYRHRAARVSKVTIEGQGISQPLEFDYALSDRAIGFAIAFATSSGQLADGGTLAVMKTLLDRQSAKPPARSAELTSAADAATAAGDNLTVLVDVAHLLAQSMGKPIQPSRGVPASLSFDLHDGGASLRVTVPASHARAIAPLVGGLGLGG